MSDFTLGDGITVTILAMGTVFFILASLWGLMELVRILITWSEKNKDMAESENQNISPSISTEQNNASHYIVDEKRKMVAILTALIEAHHDNPAIKYEVIEIERLK